MIKNRAAFDCVLVTTSLLDDEKASDKDGKLRTHVYKDNLFFCCLFYLFIYLFLAALGLCCYVRAFSICGERGLLFVTVHGLLIAMAPLCCGAWALDARASVVAARGLSSCGARA